jgi:hypothetical protein
MFELCLLFVWVKTLLQLVWENEILRLVWYFNDNFQHAFADVNKLNKMGAEIRQMNVRFESESEKKRKCVMMI